MRNVGWGTTISFAMTLCIHAIGESGSAQAQSKPAPRGSAVASALAPHWNHNGSLVSLLADGAKQKLFYDTPRVGLLDAGVKPGTLLFEGKRDGTAITGTAYQFYRTCKPRGFPVTGNTSDDKRQITLKGKAPLLDAGCKVTGTREDVLVFNVSNIAPGEPPKGPPVAQSPSASPNKGDASNPAAAGAAVVPTAPPEASRKVEAPAIEASKAKSAENKPTESGTANNAASAVSATVPAEPAKDKQAAAKLEAEKVPPPAAAKETQQKEAQQKEQKEVQLAVIPPNAANAANTPAAASAAALPSEPAKDKPPVAATGANGGPSKSDDSKTASIPATQSVAAPKAEPPKEAQLASLPGAANSAAKDDPGKSKNAAAAGGAAAPNNKPDTSKAAADGNKTPVLVENRTASAGSSEKMMEIVLKNGRTLRIGRDIEPEALLKIISLLERE
jgi:hypothetical protein